MDKITYNDLRQLQAFIFSHDLPDDITPERLKKGHRGICILLKLNNTFYVPFQWPFPTSREGVRGQVIGDGAKKEVIPLALLLDEGELLAALAKAGLGPELINLKK